MNDVKLVLLDLDGTLLDENSKIPEEFPELVQKLKKKNVHIGIASGRNKSALELAFGPLFNEMACITSNGCANYIDGKPISFDYLEVEDCRKILNHASTIPTVSFQLFFPDFVLLKEGNPMIERLNSMGFVAKPCANLEDYLEKVVLVSTIDINQKSHIDSFGKLGGSFKMVTPNYGVIDFTPKHVSKAYGACQLASHLGISIDNIMAIGDAGNDLELLQHIGYPVAMKNGMKEVKEVAKYITEYTNVEHGAICFLEKFFEL